MRTTSLLLVGCLTFGAGAQTTRPTAPAGAAPRGPSAPARLAEDDALRLLAEPLPDLDWRGVRLADVFVRLGSMVPTNFVIRWRELEQIGVTRDDILDVQTRHLTLGQVLWVVFNQVDASDARMAYTALPHAIVISSEEDLGSQMIVKLYSMTELALRTAVEDPVAYTPARRQRSAASGAGGGGEVGRADGFGLGPGMRGAAVWEFTADKSYRADVAKANQEVFEERLRRLAVILTETIEPQSWAVNGGQGSIQVYNGHFIVRNSVKVHEMIGGRLTAAETRSKAVQP